MSALSIRRALEAALDGMSPSLATAWQDAPYEPTPGTAWQRVDILHANPRPLEMSGKWHEEPGFMQVSLFYPQDAGSATIEARAELIRDTFKHGNEFTASGVTVKVSNTPSINPLDDPAWTARAVRVPFHAFIRRA